MKINKSLNIVMTAGDAKIHSIPLGYEVFKRYVSVMTQTYVKLLQEAANVAIGPRVAAIYLEDVATKQGEWDCAGGVKSGIIDEIHRTSTVEVPTDSGWENIPLEIAVKRGLISEEDLREADGKLVFFTLISHLASGILKREMIAGMTELYDVETTSLSSMEFHNSLPTSMSEGSLVVA